MNSNLLSFIPSTNGSLLNGKKVTKKEVREPELILSIRDLEDICHCKTQTADCRPGVKCRLRL